MKFVISGSIEGRFRFPNKKFIDYCWESWGNAWSIISGVDCEYISQKILLDNNNIFDGIDILLLTIDSDEVFNVAKKRGCFVIVSEHGSGHLFDTLVHVPEGSSPVQEKINFKKRLDDADAIFTTTCSGKKYLQMYTSTPILDIPAPIDLNIYKPTGVSKFNQFTICIGEVVDSSFSDRPLQLQTISIAKKLGARIVTSLNPTFETKKEDVFYLTGTDENDISFYPHSSMKNIALGYMSKSHISMMISQRPTFGRFVYMSAAMGIPCVSSEYMMARKINKNLIFSYNDIDGIELAIDGLMNNYNELQVWSESDFYTNCREQSLKNIIQMSNEYVANRICTEILPIYKGIYNRYSNMNSLKRV